MTKKVRRNCWPRRYHPGAILECSLNGLGGGFGSNCGEFEGSGDGFPMICGGFGLFCVGFVICCEIVVVIIRENRLYKSSRNLVSLA